MDLRLEIRELRLGGKCLRLCPELGRKHLHLAAELGAKRLHLPAQLRTEEEHVVVRRQDVFIGGRLDLDGANDGPRELRGSVRLFENLEGFHPHRHDDKTPQKLDVNSRDSLCWHCSSSSKAARDSKRR